MDYLAAMRAFVRSVELGSFSAAAAEAGIKVSTVSRYVASLEADLGAALFNRSSRRLHPTEIGRGFFERATGVLGDLELAREEAIAGNGAPRGLLRINAPSAFGRRHVIPHLAAFLEANPEIRIDATLTDATVDLIATGTDVAIRIGALADSGLLAKRLAPQRRIAVASPRWCERHGPIGAPGDLPSEHGLCLSLQPKPAWYFRPLAEPRSAPVAVPIEGRLRSNDSEALLQAARAGLGVALLPTWLVNEDCGAGRLVAILPAFEGMIAQGRERAIWAVYPQKRTVPPKTRALLAFLERAYGRVPYWERAAA